jgi:hypothetical protein
MVSRQYQQLPAVGGIGANCRQIETGEHITVQDVMHAKADITARESLLQSGVEDAAGHVVGAHTRLHALTSDHSAAVYPAAAPPGLQQALQPMQQALAGIQETLNQLVQQHQELRLELLQDRARAANRHIVAQDHGLTPLPMQITPDGPIFPENFPATRAVLRSMNTNQCVALLLSYDQPVQGLNSPRPAQDRLANFIGFAWTT